jgi:drug/metabolite transporter (DMT)-like permease
MNQALSVWLLLCLIWGSTWIFIKMGLSDLPPLTFAGLRFLVAAILLWLYVILRRQSLPRGWRQWGWIAASSLTFTFNYGLLFWGEKRISSGLTAVLQATIPAFGFLLAHYFIPGERITSAKFWGLSICTLGIAVIFSDQLKLEGRSALLGSAAVVIGSFAAAASNIIVKRTCQSVSPASLAAAQMTVGLIPLLALGEGFEIDLLSIRWTTNALVCLIYLATVGSALAFMLYYWLLQHTEVTRTLLISLVTPVIAVLIGMLFLHEELTWRLAVGTLAVLAGLALIVWPRATTPVAA